ncbi:MAG TPA: FAD-dependent oxidoreductase [Acidimicrobiales bacterium]|nr:FAD-dependent oxidoreductase [Acidimicrobiales bacterium]
MTGPFRRLFEPLAIGNMVVRNRIVNTTHGTALSQDRDLRYLQDRARGGAGLLGVGGSQGVANYAVGPAPERERPDWDQKAPSPATRQGIAYYDDLVIPSLRRRAEVVHAEGARCFAQVFHLGVAPHAQQPWPPIGPSAVADPYDALTPHPLTTDEIEELVQVFAHGIRRVREAGMDAAEIHGAHGYLVNNFLSPYYNRRTDRWGGSRENRVRFLAEVVSAARGLVGADFPIGVRLGVDGDGHHRGITIGELAEIGRLVSDQVAYLSVSGGSYSGLGEGYETAYVSPWYKEPGFNVPASAALKAVVDVPVIVTGRIVDASLAEGILADGAADMVGMVRALIADPELPNKARQGRIAEVRMCLGMSECHYIGPHRTPMTCAVNASAGREDEMEIVPADTPRTVVVVGAGPAGMEAARVAALRGHRVYLGDSARSLGGTIEILSRDPNRRNLRDHAVFFEAELHRLGVTLLLGHEVTAEDLVAFGPDAVVVATGGLPLVPQVPGIDGDHVATALDVLRTEAADVGPRVVVVGGLDAHLAAGTVAELLADQGRQVEYVSEHLDFAHGAEDGTRLALAHRLMNKGVVMSRCTRLQSAEAGGATLVQTFTQEERRIDDVSVVLACGLVPDGRLARELSGHLAEVHVVGDALAPRRLVHATLEGARIGRLL